MDKVFAVLSARHDIRGEVEIDTGAIAIESTGAYLAVEPAVLDPLFLDDAKEANEIGCDAFLLASAAGVAGMIKYMEVKGWCNGPDRLKAFIRKLHSFSEAKGEVLFKTPPPGGIAG